eukprot:jgi/Tetstr1/463478/TSEL_008369.t1
MGRVQSSAPGGGVDWQFRCCDGSCGRTYQRPASPLCTHVNHGMESGDPAVAAMHLAYAAAFDDPSAYWWMAAHRQAAKVTAVQELRRARHALDTADFGMVCDAAAALLALDALHPPHTATGPENTPPEEPPDLQRAPPSWGDNADEEA